TRKQAHADTLTSTAAPVLINVLQVDARDARAVRLNPLLGVSGVVDVADVKVKPHVRAAHVIEKDPELPRAEQEALLGVAVLATDLDVRPFGLGSKLFEAVHTALVNFVVRDFLGDAA